MIGNPPHGLATLKPTTVFQLASVLATQQEQYGGFEGTSLLQLVHAVQ